MNRTELMQKLKNDVKILIEIHNELEEHYNDDEWDLDDFQYQQLERITNIEEYDLDACNLAHYISGMQRVIQQITDCETALEETER